MPRKRLALLLSCAGLFFAASPASLSAQDIAFEQVGDVPIDAQDLDFDREGVLWGSSTVADFWHLDPSTLTWIGPGNRAGNHFVALNSDSLVISNGSALHRSVDGGENWTLVHTEGGALFEASLESLNHGLILSGERGGSTGIAYSTDRGGSFTSATFTVSTASTPFMESAVEIPDSLPRSGGGPAAGRLVAGVFGGVVISEDAGRTWSPSSLFQDARFWVQRVEIGTDPGTGDRRLYASLADATLPDVQFYVSDDDGLTWVNQPDMEDAFLFVYVPQDDGYLLAVERGTALEGDFLTVWQSDDSGMTWAVVEELPAPVNGAGVFSEDMLIGPDGHVYVAVSRAGSEREWVYRTTEPVVVAGEPEVLPEPTAVPLVVYPNPADDRITVQGVEPGEEVVLYDVLGRAVLRTRTPANIDVSALPPGVYVLRAGGESRLVTVRR